MTRIKILYQKIKQESKGKFDDQNIPLVTKVWTQYWDIDIISIVMFEPKVLAIDKWYHCLNKASWTTIVLRDSSLLLINGPTRIFSSRHWAVGVGSRKVSFHCLSLWLVRPTFSFHRIQSLEKLICPGWSPFDRMFDDCTSLLTITVFAGHKLWDQYTHPFTLIFLTQWWLFQCQNSVLQFLCGLINPMLKEAK